MITHFWMIKKRPSHGKIVILTAVYFSANHEKHLLTFLVLQNGVRPTERALRQFTQPRRNFTYYTISHWNNCVSIPPAVSHDTTLKLGAPVCIWWLYGGVKSFLKDALSFSCTFDFIRIKMLYPTLKYIDQLFVHLLKKEYSI